MKRFTKDARQSVHEEEAGLYLEEYARARGWASVNRDLIALCFLEFLEPGSKVWELGPNGVTETPASIVSAARTAVQARRVVDIHHNNVEQTTWPPPNPSSDSPSATPCTSEKVYLHRKGAAPTYNPHTKTALAILPLPGSRATPTMILHPTFMPTNTHAHLDALSLAHGVGRALFSAKAATYIAEKYADKADDLLRAIS